MDDKHKQHVENYHNDTTRKSHAARVHAIYITKLIWEAYPDRYIPDDDELIDLVSDYMEHVIEEYND